MDENELQAINRHAGGTESAQMEQDANVDGGRDAWLVLASVFVQGALVWGM